MSSVAQGNAFEDRVFNAVKAELEGDPLGLSPASAKPFKKKGYYSRDRDADIVVDVSIEVWLPSADQWSMLWVCECKDYSGSVPVNEIEEFKAKLDQIGGANKKGVMAISGALQAGTLKFARANGIGIIRLLPDEQVRHVMYYMTSDMVRDVYRLDATEFLRALTQSGFTGVNRDFYAESEGYISGDWGTLLKRSLNSASR